MERPEACFGCDRFTDRNQEIGQQTADFAAQSIAQQRAAIHDTLAAARNGKDIYNEFGKLQLARESFREASLTCRVGHCALEPIAQD